MVIIEKSSYIVSLKEKLWDYLKMVICSIWLVLVSTCQLTSNWYLAAYIIAVYLVTRLMISHDLNYGCLWSALYINNVIMERCLRVKERVERNSTKWGSKWEVVNHIIMTLKNSSASVSFFLKFFDWITVATSNLSDTHVLL